MLGIRLGEFGGEVSTSIVLKDGESPWFSEAMRGRPVSVFEQLFQSFLRNRFIKIIWFTVSINWLDRPPVLNKFGDLFECDHD